MLASDTAEVATAEPAAEQAPAASSEETSGGGGGGAGSSQAASQASSSAPMPPASKPKAKSAGTYTSGGGGSLKDYGLAEVRSYEGGYVRTRGVWAQGFFDYDRHENIAPGNQENPTRRSYTGGVMSGADWTVAKRSEVPVAMQFGIFSGYSHTKSKFSDTTFRTDETGDGFLDTDYRRSNSEQEVDGPFIGAYTAYSRGAWTTDLALKADFFDLDQSSKLTQTCGNFADDPTDTILSDIGQQRGSADVTSFTIAANAQYRHDLSPNSWLAPTAGIRFTHTDFSNDRSTATFTDDQLDGDTPTPGTATPGTLGLDDGYSIRLQAGLRYGERRETAEGYLWTMTLGAFLYSDVLVEGFTGFAGQTGEIVGPVDEGELRVLGQFASQLEIGNGLSYQLLAEVRGGEDVIGAGGLLGVRYEW